MSALTPKHRRETDASNKGDDEMTVQGKMEPAGLGYLRHPFPDNQISKLPKPTKAQTDAVKADYKAGIRCEICGSWHHPKVVHLDYVGHAALTDRLLDTDIEWSWEPVAFNADGLPAFDRNGGMWIKLTVCGVTRLGYGHAGDKSGGDAIKEIIGDALRNAAMRFGAALDLWHKGDLHADEPEAVEVAQEPAKKQPQHSKLKTELRQFVHELEGCGDWDTYCGFRDTPEFQRLTSECREKLPQYWDGSPDMPEEFVPLRRRIEILETNLGQQIADLARA